jgi:hypothetical protein
MACQKRLLDRKASTEDLGSAQRSTARVLKHGVIADDQMEREPGRDVVVNRRRDLAQLRQFGG